MVREDGRLRGEIAWECVCMCGKTIRVTTNHLRFSRVKSCGCWYKESRATVHSTHGMAGAVKGKAPEYKAWISLRERCNNPNFIGFKNYGGRGIRVCGRWNDFTAFLSDMGPKPGPEYSVEREDVNGNYEPSNCSWATRREQSRNTTRNHFISAFGITKVLSDWAAQTGLSRAAIRKRIERGIPPEQALQRKLSA